MANLKSLIDVDWERGKALRTAYPEITAGGSPSLQAKVNEIAKKADDWQFYRHYSGAVNTGYIEVKFALSPSLGLSRPLSVGEYYELNSCSLELYEKYHGPVPDPLSPEQMALREASREPRERRFRIQLSYSTIGTSPEDALKTFFSAVRQPGAMIAEIFEEGVDGGVEIDGDEIVAIAAREFGQPVADDEPEVDNPAL